jgi:hypothetical protein
LRRNKFSADERGFRSKAQDKKAEQISKEIQPTQAGFHDRPISLVRSPPFKLVRNSSVSSHAGNFCGVQSFAQPAPEAAATTQKADKDKAMRTLADAKKKFKFMRAKSSQDPHAQADLDRQIKQINGVMARLKKMRMFHRATLMRQWQLRQDFTDFSRKK